MRYLAMTAPISAEKLSETSIEEQIVAASPILEAYGNAKTVMNNNSSRFGKFTKLLYNVPENSQNGNILGSSLETYLLEKSRVVFQALNERNYHIFYFLHEGLGKNNVEYGLESIDKFNYTNQGKCFTPFKDLERFKELKDSLTKFRIDEQVQDTLWKLTAGILNLGNINFIRTGDGFTDIDKKSMKYLQIVSKLWGLKASELEKRLTTQSLKISRNEIIQKVQFDNAVSNRDSIAKGIYENIFLWLAKRINAELLVDNNDDDIDENKTDEENGNYFIGILDVFGFENFYFNSLEQFCINYTNEKLQQYFNFHIIASEQEEYLKESVFWKPLTIPDNEQYIKLVENQKVGFFTLLDSACNGPSKNDTVAFMQTLFKKHKDNQILTKKTKAGSGNWRGEKPKSSGSRRKGAAKFDGFMINHFADDVTYDISKFLIKNSEQVHGDTNKMIKKSTEQIFKEINGVDGLSKQRRRSKKKKSVTAVFYSGIKRLMKSLNQTEPYFVRCINPNKQKSNKVWTESIVEHQLRCGGLIEALRVLKLGYPTRVPYQLLYEKYHGSVTNPLIKNMTAEAFSTSLLIAFDVNENDYELGLTKIFFKPAKAAILDTIMSKAGQPLTKQQNEKITKYIVGKRCKQMIGTLKAGMKLIKMVRMKRAEKQWQEKGRIAAILGGTVMKHLIMARKQIMERKQKHAAIMMQTYFRSMNQRRDFIKKIDQVKMSTDIILQSYKSMQARQGLQIFLDAQVEKTRIAKKREEEEKAAAAAKAKEAAAAATASATKTPTESRSVAGEDVTVETKEPELTREQQLEIARKEQQERVAEAKRIAEQKAQEALESKEREDRELREQIEREKAKQIERGSIESDTKLNKIKDIEAKEARKKAKAEKIAKSKADREQQDRKARKDLEKKRRQRRKNKYRVNEADQTDYDTSSDEEDNLSDPDDGSDEEEEDVETLLPRFHKIAAMGQLFFRHAGSKNRNRPQDRVVKVAFHSNGKPKEISWGSGSRKIAFNDVLYVAYGHYTPVFDVRKDFLDKKKCFSVVAKDGKTLDLEGYSENVAELWVRGLRRLLGQNDEKAEIMAKKNFKNLLNATKEAKKAKSVNKRQINDIMRLQQDLFIMSTHTVFRNLDEERIWNVNQTVRDKFSPKEMYQVALKADIPWRQWQHWIREKVTTYCRENNLVNVETHSHRQQQSAFNIGVPVNNNNNQPQHPANVYPVGHHGSHSMINVVDPYGGYNQYNQYNQYDPYGKYQAQPQPQPQPPQYQSVDSHFHQLQRSLHSQRSLNPQQGGHQQTAANNAGNNNDTDDQKGGTYVEEEKCTLM